MHPASRRTTVVVAAASLLALAGCPGPGATLDGGADRAVMDTPAPPTDTPAPPTDTRDAPPEPFDAGPPPTCDITAMARHVVDRPGGDRVADPSGFLPVTGGGFLAALRRYDFAPGGDGGVAPLTRDSIEMLALGADGTPRGATTAVYDGHPTGMTLDQPVMLPVPNGAFVIFQASRGLPSDPSFVIELQSSARAPDGSGMAPTVLRDRYGRPAITTLVDNSLFGVASRVDSATDGGLVTTLPFSMHLGPDGTNLRAQDVNVNAFIPFDALDTQMRAVPGGGAVYVMRTGGHLGLLGFNAMGMVDVRGVQEVRGANLPALDDAQVVGDGVVAVYSRALGAHTEVHTIVAGRDGTLRLDRELESYDGEGPTVASAALSYGGVALFWRRGVDARARVRVAVVSPDGVVRVAPTDLVTAANIEGRVLASVDGRRVSFLVRDGRDTSNWGYTFGQACLPAM